MFGFITRRNVKSRLKTHSAVRHPHDRSGLSRGRSFRGPTGTRKAAWTSTLAPGSGDLLSPPAASTPIPATARPLGEGTGSRGDGNPYPGPGTVEKSVDTGAREAESEPCAKLHGGEPDSQGSWEPVAPLPVKETRAAPTITATRGADSIVEYRHADRKLRACQVGHCHEARQEILMGESLVSVACDTSRKRRLAAGRLWAPTVAHDDHHNGRPQMPITQPEMEKVEGTVPEVAKSHLPPSVCLEDANGTVGLDA